MVPTQPGHNNTVYWEEQQLLGTSIGQYEVSSFLGRGGTAMVFKVHDLDTGMDRALKITAAEPTEAELHRFKREFRVMSRLAHPHVIAVYRYGIHETRPYFVMELIEGCDLRAHLRKWTDSAAYYERVAEALCQVTRALAYIHDRHIIHRDLKPGNILVTQQGQAKVMDFGIAFEIDVSARQSRAQALMGTLAYVSPEQATGRKVDARSDLYSLGVILYEVLTGIKPFSGTTLSQVIYKHLHEQPKSPCELNQKVPLRLSDLAGMLLAKRAHERPQSAQEVLVMLEAFIASSRPVPQEELPVEVASDAPPLNEPRFVGREIILEALRTRLTAWKDGHPGLALITGDPGLGKSRLIDELCREELLEGALVLTSRCLPQATTPYQGFRDILRAAVRQLEKEVDSILAVLTLPQRSALVRAVPDLESIMLLDEQPEIASQIGAPEWLILFTAARATLDQLMITRPVMLVFDDLDRADEASLALLQALARTLIGGMHSRRLFIIGTARPDAVRPAQTGPTGQDESNSPLHPQTGSYAGRLQILGEILGPTDTPLTIQLSPLTSRQSEEMIRSMLGHAEDPEGLADYIYHQSEGNPFFIEAILRALAAQGILTRRDHTVTGFEWTVHLDKVENEPTALAIPVGLQVALQKRLSLLEPRDLMVLQVAAVFGEPFGYKLIRDATELDEDTLLDVLDRLLKAHLLVERTGDGEAIYDLSHGKARELVSSELPTHERVLVHQRVGRVLALRKDESLTMVVGRHLFDGHLYDEALPYLLRSGERFVRQQLYRLALKPLRQAEEILSLFRVPMEGRNDQPEFLRLYHSIGLALRGVGRGEESFHYLALALDAVRPHNDFAREADIQTGIGHIHRERGEYRQAREHYEAAMACLRQAGQSHRVGDTILGLGEILNRQGLISRATAVYAEARDLALELQSKPGLAGSYLGLGEVALQQGQTHESLRRTQEALNLFRWLEDRPAIAQALGNIGEIHRIHGHFTKALETLDEATMMAREYDLQSRLVGLTTILGEVYLNLNAPTQAEGPLSEGLNLCKTHNFIFSRAALFRVWGMMKELQGEFSEALEAYRQGLALAQGISAQVLTARFLVQVANLQLIIGEVSGARRLIDKAVTDLRATGAMFACAEAYLVASRVRLADGDRLEAHSAINDAIGLAEMMDARDLYFRALYERMEMPILPESASKNVGLIRAAGTLLRMVEGAGPLWRNHLRQRPDIAKFLRDHPAFSPREESLTSLDRIEPRVR